MSWFRRQPEPPKNCTITRTNGEVIPLEFVYEGRQRIEGSRRKIHVWQAVTKTYVSHPSWWMAYCHLARRFAGPCSWTRRI